MPTPRPIIVARIGVIVLKSVKPAARVSVAMPSPTASRARKIGRSAAITVPNTIRSTITAARRPSASDAPCSGCSCTALPVKATWTGEPATAARTSSLNVSIVPAGSVQPCWSNCTSA